MEPDTMRINNVEYVRKDTVVEKSETFDGMKYCVIRTYSAGVHIGYVKTHKGIIVELINSRRLWQWEKAASLSQVSQEGCKSNKLAMVVPAITLIGVIEIIPCSKKAQKSIQEKPEWKI